MNTLIPSNLHEALVAQFNRERYNSACYKSMQSAFEEMNWHGFAAWCSKAANEEMTHSEKLFAYLADRQMSITVSEVPTPPQFNGEDVIANFEAALALEVGTTSEFNHLARLAADMDDWLTFQELQWFLHEQVEEEAKVVQVISDLTHAGSGAGYILIDARLGGA